jgi:cytidine deaminase
MSSQKNIEIKVEYTELKLEELSLDEQELVRRAVEVRDSAYAPYSKFKVGVAILTRSGEIFTGANVEVANYKGTCAERSALMSAFTANKRDEISKITVFGAPGAFSFEQQVNVDEDPVTPCGQCRQDLKEVEDLLKLAHGSDQSLTMIMASGSKVWRMEGIHNLLPLAFGPANLA